MFERLGRFLSANHKDIALIALLFLLPLLCFADVVFLPNSFYYLDIELVQFPGKVFLTELLAEGQLGHWNPYIFMGYPLLSEPEIGPLYPLNLLFALPIPHYYALTLFVVLHYSLAGIFTYLLTRSLGIGRSGSFIAGMVFAFSGFMMAQLTNFNILTSSTWLPLILCLFSLALRKRSYAYALGAGVVLAIQVLPAHPQILTYTLLILGFYYVYSLLLLPRRDLRSIGNISLISLTTVVLGMALAAVQLIPAYQLKEFSALSESPGYEFVTAYSLPRFRLLSLLFPTFLGNLAVGYRGEAYFEEHHAYVAILPLMLAVLAWGKRKDPQARFFGLLAPLSVLLALGGETPLYHLLVHVPVFNWYRIPSRWLLALTLSLAVLAGYGFDHLLAYRERPSHRNWAKWLVVAGVLLAVSLPSLFFFQKQIVAAINFVIDNVYAGEIVRVARVLARNLPRFPDAELTNLLARLFPPLLNPLILFLLMFNASAVLLLLFLGNKLSPRMFKGLAAVLIAFDLFMAGGTTINLVEDSTYFDKRASVVYLEKDLGLARIYSPDRHGEAPQKLLDYYPMVHRIQSIGSLPSVSVLTPRRYNEFMDALRQNTRLLNLAGVRYILTELEEPPEWWHNNLRQVYRKGGLSIYENLDAMPRAFVVHRAEVPGSDEAIVALLTGEEFDLSSSILLEDRDALDRLAGMALGSSTMGETSDVNIVEYEPNRVVIEVSTSQPGFLFLSDTHHPDWRVFVDGEKETLYRADYLFRAVLVPPGNHRVEFRFQPDAFWLGLAVSLLAVLGLLAATVILIRRRQASATADNDTSREPRPASS